MFTVKEPCQDLAWLHVTKELGWSGLTLPVGRDDHSQCTLSAGSTYANDIELEPTCMHIHVYTVVYTPAALDSY